MVTDVMDPRRRRLLQGMFGGVLASVLPINVWADSSPPLLSGTLLSACDDRQGRHYIASVLPSGNLGFQIPVPLRAHDSCATSDRSRAFFFARRPGHHLYVVDLHAGRLAQTVEAAPGRHFYGHGVVSRDDQWLFASEQIFATGQGIIGIYRLADPIKREGEIPAHGMDPHQLHWLSDGETLVIANGGIRTHPDQHREILNPDTLQPVLTYVRVRDGALLESCTPPHHQMSLHHLDVSPTDQVIVGVQYYGALTDDIALVGSHRRGTDPQWWKGSELNQLRMQQYTASVAVAHTGNKAVVSCPRGNVIAEWDLQNGKLLQLLELRDGAGLSRQWQQSGWIGTSGEGEVVHIGGSTHSQLHTLGRYPLRWDNHATLI